MSEKEHYEIDRVIACYDCKRLYSGPFVVKCPVCRSTAVLYTDANSILELFNNLAKMQSLLSKNSGE